MLKSIPKRFFLFTLISFLVTSCASQTFGSVVSTATSFPSETPLPTDLPLSMETATPEVATPPNTFATQFCMGAAAPWSCTCGELSSDYLDVRDGLDAGTCDITMPQRYRITLPDSWYCNAVGVFAHNLSCMTAHGQRIRVRSVVSDLPLANADESIHILREGDGVFSEPVVEPGEERIKREIRTIGQMQTLSLLTRQNNTTFALRYFLKDHDNLYILIVESEDLDEVNGMTVLLEEIIHSVQFIE